MASEKGGEVLQTLPDSSFTPKLFDNFEVDVLATSLTSAMYQIYLGVGPGEMHDGSWQVWKGEEGRGVEFFFVLLNFFLLNFVLLNFFFFFFFFFY